MTVSSWSMMTSGCIPVRAPGGCFAPWGMSRLRFWMGAYAHGLLPASPPPIVCQLNSTSREFCGQLRGRFILRLQRRTLLARRFELRDSRCPVQRPIPRHSPGAKSGHTRWPYAQRAELTLPQAIERGNDEARGRAPRNFQ